MAVAVKPFDPVDQLEAALGALCHRDGDCAVELDHRRGRDLPEPRVQLGDLRPVGLVLEMERRDRRLQLVRARPPQPQRAVEHAPPLVDARLVPERAVLVFEQDELAT